MATESLSVVRRAQIHAALGDPTRLAIVDMLTMGDASPGEIAQILELPTNLVAHHTRILSDSGLVVRSASEGDRRRTYLRLVVATLDSLRPPPLRSVRRVVFVCSHNSARSQLAAAHWARRSDIPTASAGTEPAARVHRRAVRVGRRHGLNIDANSTAHISDVVRATDFIVAVCDNAHETLPASARPSLHWSVPDPAAVNTDAAFESAYVDLAARIDRLAPTLIRGDDIP